MKKIYAIQYLEFLKNWATTRHRVKWAWPLSFEEWCQKVTKEEEQDILDYERHVQSMRSIHRYI